MKDDLYSKVQREIYTCTLYTKTPIQERNYVNRHEGGSQNGVERIWGCESHCSRCAAVPRRAVAGTARSGPAGLSGHRGLRQARQFGQREVEREHLRAARVHPNQFFAQRHPLKVPAPLLRQVLPAAVHQDVGGSSARRGHRNGARWGEDIPARWPELPDRRAASADPAPPGRPATIPPAAPSGQQVPPSSPPKHTCRVSESHGSRNEPALYRFSGSSTHGGVASMSRPSSGSSFSIASFIFQATSR